MNNSGESRFHNVPLTELGQNQITRTAKALSKEYFDALYCSPLERALQTATILYKKLRIKPYAHADFSETGFSGGEKDIGRKQMQAVYPHIILDPSITNDGWAPKSETSQEAYIRACRLALWLISSHPNPDSRILMVTHGHFGSLFIGCLIGLEYDGHTHFSQHNGCISRIDLTNDHWKIRFLNRVSHLPEKMIT